MNTVYIVGICLVVFLGPVAGFFGIAVSKYRTNLIHNKEEATKGLAHHLRTTINEIKECKSKGDYSFLIGFLIFLFAGWVSLLLASTLPPKKKQETKKKV